MLAEPEIIPSQPEDLEDLSLFLRKGFGTPSAANFAPDVLLWKYFDPCGTSEGARSFITRRQGRIMGHIGLCPRSFVIRGESPREVPTLHVIDWLASPEDPLIGLSLLEHGLSRAATQYFIGGSPQAQGIAALVGYEELSTVSVYHRVLRPAAVLRALSGDRDLLTRAYGKLRRELRSLRSSERLRLASVARAVARLGEGLLRGGRARERRVDVRRVRAFGAEAEAVGDGRTPLVFTTRSHDLLNHSLRHPGGHFSGWTIHDGGRVIGVAILGVLPVGGIRRGKIVDCFLDSDDEALHRGAVGSLVRELRALGADDVTSWASTPWMSRALATSGFHPLESGRFFLRDPERLVARDLPFHLTQLEGDNAYI